MSLAIVKITAALLIVECAGLSQQSVPASTSPEKPARQEAHSKKRKKPHDSEKSSDRPGGTRAELGAEPADSPVTGKPIVEKAVVEAAPAPAAEAEPAPARLPKTGSPYPLIGFGGLCALFLAVLLWLLPRVWRKKA